MKNDKRSMVIRIIAIIMCALMVLGVFAVGFSALR